MSRLAGRLMLALIASALAPAFARAADAPVRAEHRGGYAAVQEGGCGGFKVITAWYEEQVCRRGVAGYAACDWVEREHQVRVPVACAPEVTSEDAWPADRGARWQERIGLKTRG